MSSLCKTCKHADIATKPRTIVKQNVKVVQGVGSIVCDCQKVKEISITDGEMRCSDYDPV